MKKTFLLILIFLFAMQFSACSISAFSRKPSSAELVELAKMLELDRHDVTEMFNAFTGKHVSVEDTILFSDYAEGVVGAVLYRDLEHGISHIAFFEADGNGTQVGFHGRFVSEIKYHGNGIVSFKTEMDNGDIYNEQLSLWRNKNGLQITHKRELCDKAYENEQR